VNRSEHITWCKLRALNILDKGRIQEALEGYIFDMNKHPQTQINSALTMQALHYVAQHDFDGAREFIERFS
jgi:hypothetical protein